MGKRTFRSTFLGPEKLHLFRHCEGNNGLTCFRKRFHFLHQSLRGAVYNRHDLFQFCGGERRRQRSSNTFPRFIARQKQTGVERRVGFYELRPIRELPEILHHDLLHDLRIADHNGGCSTNAHLINATILVKVVQQHLVHPAIFEDVRKVTNPWPWFGTRER